MKALVTLLGILAPLTVIVTGWWNLAIRKKVAAARIDAARRGVTEKVRVESTFATWMRRILTTTVVLVVCAGLLVGAAAIFKSALELF